MEGLQYVCDEGLKVEAKNCVTGKHHLRAQRSVDAQSLSHINTHKNTVTKSLRVIVEREKTSPIFPALPGGLDRQLPRCKCSPTQLHLTSTVIVVKYAVNVKLNAMHY